MKKFFQNVLSKIKHFDKTLNDYKKSTEGSAQIPYLAYLTWGMSLSETTDLDEAVDKLETAAVMQPNSPDVHLNLAQLYMKSDRYNDAIKHLNKTVRLDKKNAVAFSLTASCYILLNDYKNAEYYYKKAEALQPYNEEIHMHYATTLARKGFYEKALSIYNKILSFFPSYILALLYSSIILVTNKNDIDTALERLEKANQTEKNNADILLYLGICKYKKEKYQEALETILKSLELNPNSNDGIITKGVCLARVGKEAESLACFSANENGNENNAYFYLCWGLALQIFERYAEAKQKFLLSFELDRDNESTLTYLADNYIKEGNITPAYQLLQKIVYKNPKNASAYEKLGNLAYQKTEFKQAIEYFTNAMKVSREHNHLFLNIAKCYYYLDEIKNCETYYLKAIDYNPDCIEAYTKYASLQIQLGNDKEALRKIRTAYKKNQNSFEVNNIYSQILIKMEMYRDALEKLNKIIETEPNYYEALFTKAEVLQALNKPQEALDLMDLLPDKYKDTREYLYIKMISYNNLAQQIPSHYNISKAIEYCDKLTDKYVSEYKPSDIRHRLEELLKTIDEGK